MLQKENQAKQPQLEKEVGWKFRFSADKKASWQEVRCKSQIGSKLQAFLLEKLLQCEKESPKTNKEKEE